MNLYIENKPSILIKHLSAEFPKQWAEVLFGIEEEGIPYQLQQDNDNDLAARAYSAAQLSALSVGIACGGFELVIHQKNLPANQPLFKADIRTVKNSDALRALGSNAARLVKGIPFKSVFDQTGE